MNRILSRQEERLSRFVAMVLRHRPEIAGVKLQEDGWVDLPDLLAGVQMAWRKCPVTKELLLRIADLDEKGRYEVDTIGRPHRMRACYGHSVDVTLNYPEVTPPALLFHGTARRFLGRIWSAGLQGMGRQYVHLTDDLQTAREVGGRRDSYPIILAIDTRAMSREGCVFYSSGAGLYLTERVPTANLKIHEDPLADRPGGTV